jgi:ATP-dependent DNA helicase RecQ
LGYRTTGQANGQREVIEAVLSGRNAVVVMPTGAGKSLCYQLPATILSGTTLVISPLIALMKDQVEQLCAKGISATYINSTLDESERSERLAKLRSGAFKLVYVAPERFRSGAFLDALSQVQIDLFAVDEAHCISQWGHDFRPDYALLGRVRKKLRPPRTVALTATATPEVRDDLVKSLLMKDPQVFVAGFDRSNLFLEVAAVTGEAERRHAVLAVAEEKGSGIVYCSTRKGAEALFDTLKGNGRTVVMYHAGMTDEERDKAQDQFMASPNSIAVATNAFGMGIDKPDIRFVVHAQIPKAVEAYYQEIGRAGRDGKPARAVLLFNHSDVYTQERLIESTHPSETVFSDVWNILVETETYDYSLEHLASQVGASAPEVGAAIRIFEREGKISRLGRGEGVWRISLLSQSSELKTKSPQVQSLLAHLQSQSATEYQADLSLLAQRTEMSVDEVRHALTQLERSRAVRVRRPFAGRTMRVTTRLGFQDLGMSLARVREQERRALLLLKRMTDYAYSKTCRRTFLLRYFGERANSTECSGCDVCSGTTVSFTKVKAGYKPGKTEAVMPAQHNDFALGELRRWRRELSKDLGVPAFIIFNDAALIGLASSLPTDRASFLAVKGTGPSRWERFGAKVVEISTLARAAASTH